MTTSASITIAATAFANQNSSGIPGNAQNQNNSNQINSKAANPTKTSPPKLSPVTPVVSSLSPPSYPAVLGRGATLPQKSKVPPPVPPRGSPKPKRDLPATRGKIEFMYGCMTSYFDHMSSSFNMYETGEDSVQGNDEKFLGFEKSGEPTDMS